MNRYRILSKIMAASALVAAILGIYWRWARPHHLRWGATDEEATRVMPGDELNPQPAFRATRAITVEAKPDAIWPWLVQMGYGRAGFYGYDILENLGSPRGLRSADRIVPELQNVKVGDTIPLSAAGGLVLRSMAPNEHLVWAGGPGWGGITWALYAADEEHTRLVSRVQFTHGWGKPGQLAFDLFTEFADYLAVRKILQGVKDRVEGRRESMPKANAEFAVYLGSLFVFLGAVVSIFVRPLTWRRWLAAFAAGVGWLFTWYAPAPLWAGALAELLVLWELARAGDFLANWIKAARRRR